MRHIPNHSPSSLYESTDLIRSSGSVNMLYHQGDRDLFIGETCKHTGVIRKQSTHLFHASTTKKSPEQGILPHWPLGLLLCSLVQSLQWEPSVYPVCSAVDVEGERPFVHLCVTASGSKGPSVCSLTKKTALLFHTWEQARRFEARDTWAST